MMDAAASGCGRHAPAIRWQLHPRRRPQGNSRRSCAKLLRSVAIVVLTAFGLCPAPAAEARQAEGRAVTVGMVLDGPRARGVDEIALFREEVLRLLERDFRASFPDVKVLTGDWTPAGVGAALDQLLADPAVDVIIANGVLASHLAATRASLPRPVVAPWVLDAGIQGIPREGDGSGVGNLAYLGESVWSDLETFHDIVPFARVAVLTPDGMMPLAPILEPKLASRAAAAGFEAGLVGVGAEAAPALAQLAEGGYDAAWILPLPRLTADGFAQLLEGCIEAGIPTFSWAGEVEVRAGAFAGRRTEDFPRQVARLSGLHVQNLLNGWDAGELRVDLVGPVRLTINMDTARRIGVFPPWRYIAEAELLGDEVAATTAPRTLESTVRDALVANRDLAAASLAVEAGSKDVRVAAARLWPQVGVYGEGRQIDDDRAAAAFGIFPETTLSVGATLDQELYTDRSWARRSIEKSLQESREEDLATLRLDIAWSAGTAYLDLLHLQTTERVQRENLDLTQANLERARVRQITGAASPGEVYRWEAQIAKNRRAVVQVRAATAIARIEVNRLLGAPLDLEFATVEADLEDPRLVASLERILWLTENPQRFSIFEDFLLEETLARAKEREVASTTRAFWLPDFRLQADLFARLAESGEGQDTPQIPGLTEYSEPDDTYWSVALLATYPLFNGGAKLAERGRARLDVRTLQHERESTTQLVEQRLMTALRLLAASRASLDLARTGAEASASNLGIVQDSYSRGVADVIELLDAQNAALVAKLDVATVYYEFLSDLFLTLRAVGTFDYFLSGEERTAFLDRLEVFLTEREAQ